ncbi:MAG: PD-(D/E)XK nuclease family protein, partial [Bacteroidales bacterium]|nr:PD-(D/E)XK nuclease family protein [Bacteroidales bacterium]
MKKTGYWGISKLEKLEEDDDFKKLIDITKKKKKTIFDIIDKKRDELIFSSVLKYFLDPKEDHNLQDYFLHKFFHLLINDNPNNLKIKKVFREILDSSKLSDANVFKEYSIGEDGRLDIVIKLPNKLVCVVEVKLFSYEGNEQTLR